MDQTIVLFLQTKLIVLSTLHDEGQTILEYNIFFRLMLPGPFSQFYQVSFTQLKKIVNNTIITKYDKDGRMF